MTAPGPIVAGYEGSVDLARTCNKYLADIRDQDPSRYGFLGCMPDLRNTPAALAEIDHCFDTLHADGIVLLTRYGDNNNYLGHPDFAPIWLALNARKACVLIYPTHAVETNLVAQNLPQSIVDYPHETARTAVDIIMSNGRRSYPEAKVILSHAGGTLPYIIKCAASLVDTGLTTKT